MRWETWTLAAALLAGGLAGCVKPIDEEEPWDERCEGCAVCVDFRGPSYACCASSCGAPPPVRPTPSPPHPWQPRACPVYNETLYSSFSPAHEASAICAVPVPPPLLAPLVPRLLASGCACERAAIASDGARILVATEAMLVVADAHGAEVATIPYATGRIELPHVSFGHDGRAWIAGIDRALPTPRVALMAYDGGDGFAEAAFVDVTAAPLAPLVERAYVAPTDQGALVVLVADEAAWGVRYSAGMFGAFERLTPLGGDALVGPPTLDARGRVLVPFAFTPRDPLQAITGSLAPATRSTSLQYLALADHAGDWSTNGGMGVPQGAASAPSVELTPSGVAAFVWVDASGVLRRIETWDEGTSWGTPTIWSDAAATVHGRPAAARAGTRSTVAWWEDASGAMRLAVARSEGGPIALAREVAVEKEGADDAALALLADGRAVVAWVNEEGEVWAAIEGGHLPASSCDDRTHCAPQRHA